VQDAKGSQVAPVFLHALLEVLNPQERVNELEIDTDASRKGLRRGDLNIFMLKPVQRRSESRMFNSQHPSGLWISPSVANVAGSPLDADTVFLIANIYRLNRSVDYPVPSVFLRIRVWRPLLLQDHTSFFSTIWQLSRGV
jgi:hypothetical protein